MDLALETFLIALYVTVDDLSQQYVAWMEWNGIRDSTFWKMARCGLTAPERFVQERF